mmetsp:Transcript_28245/g.58348  ORF Transcript_28245/g.58348 Transcript_28245/m.58348 type:complete len:256 (+) Transcript_28245:108-875(+)
MGHLHEEQGFNCREVHLVVLLQCSLEEDTLLLPAGSQQCLQATQELPDLQFLQALFLKGIRSPDLLSIEAYGSATEEDGDLCRRMVIREAMQGPEAPEVLQGAIHSLGDLHLHTSADFSPNVGHVLNACLANAVESASDTGHHPVSIKASTLETLHHMTQDAESRSGAGGCFQACHHCLLVATEHANCTGSFQVSHHLAELPLHPAIPTLRQEWDHTAVFPQQEVFPWHFYHVIQERQSGRNIFLLPLLMQPGMQ